MRGIFFGGDLQSNASIGPYREQTFRLQRQSVSYLWYFIPALIVQAR